MRIVYMGSPASAVKPLAYLLEHLGDEHELLGVVSQPAKLVGRGRKKAPQDPPVAQYAKERQLAVLQPQKARDIGFLEELKKMIAVKSFMIILTLIILIIYFH